MAKRKSLPALHELEAEVMEAVWAQGEATVRQVMEILNASAPKPRAYTTYMTIMRRLDDKKLLKRRRDGKTDFYRPAYTREEYAQRRAQAEVDALVDRYGEVALGHFARPLRGGAPRAPPPPRSSSSPRRAGGPCSGSRARAARPPAARATASWRPA